MKSSFQNRPVAYAQRRYRVLGNSDRGLGNAKRALETAKFGTDLRGRFARSHVSVFGLKNLRFGNYCIYTAFLFILE